MIAWIAVALASSPSCWQGIGVAASGTYVRFDWSYTGTDPIHLRVSPDFALECRGSATAPVSAWFGVDLHPWLRLRNLRNEERTNFLMARIGPSVAFGRFDLAVQGLVGIPFLGGGVGLRFRPGRRNEAVVARIGVTAPGPTLQASLLYSFGPRISAPNQED